MWNLQRLSRRSPFDDLGSVPYRQCGDFIDEKKLRTFWVILKNIEIAVTVCDKDVKLLAVRQKVGRYDFKFIQDFAKERHFVWFLLYCQKRVSAVSFIGDSRGLPSIQ